MTYEELINSPAGEFVMFASKDGKVRIECRFESDTLWLSQATICELYGKAKATISGHIKNIFDEGELVENSVVRFYRTTASDGKVYNVQYFSLPAILAIADEAKAFLAAQGLDQWQHGYPAEEDFRRDIERGDGWLFTADGNPAGYLCISRRSEAAYTAIEGEWLSCAGPYLTIHRIMVSDAYRGKGIASEMISLADDFAHAYCCAGVRIDTAPGNEPMRAMLRKNGFETCGTIRLVGGVDDGALRIALEKLVER